MEEHNCPYTLNTTGAIISECEQYRYQLARIWDSKKPIIAFIMLNPSTADANKDDATIRRCLGFAKSWGYGGIKVVNLFPFRATDPKKILKARNPFGEMNYGHIFSVVNNCDKAVCAWGNGVILTKMKKKFPAARLLVDVPEEKLFYIDMAKDGTPKHPLYLPKAAELKKYNLITQS